MSHGAEWHNSPGPPEPCAPGVSPVLATGALQLWLSHNFCECAGGWDWIVVLKAWQRLLWTPLCIHAPGKTGIYMNSLKILDKNSTMKYSLGSHG